MLTQHLGAPVGGALHANTKALAYHLGEGLPQGRFYSPHFFSPHWGACFPVRLRSPKALWAMTFVGREPQPHNLRAAGFEAL